MSITSSARFGVYDLLTRIIPGGVLVTLVWIVNILESQPETATFPLSFSSTTDIILTGVVFFVVGEIVNQMRISIHPVPFPFRRLIAKQSHNSNYLPLHTQAKNKISTAIPFSITPYLPDRIHQHLFDNESTIVSTDFRHGFWNDLRNHFGVDERISSVSDIWGLFSVYMETRSTAEIQRMKTNLYFLANLFISLILGLYMAIVLTIQEPKMAPVAFGFAFLLTIAIVYAVAPLLSFVESKYVEKLLIAYYLEREVDQFNTVDTP
jgi:hypothetical protein